MLHNNDVSRILRVKKETLASRTKHIVERKMDNSHLIYKVRLLSLTENIDLLSWQTRYQVKM